MIHSMTEKAFEAAMENGELDMEYSEYIESQTPIGNGTMLINAIESGRYYDGFRDRMVDYGFEEKNQ